MRSLIRTLGAWTLAALPIAPAIADDPPPAVVVAPAPATTVKVVKHISTIPSGSKGKPQANGNGKGN